MKKTLVVTMTILLICGIAHATDTTKFGVDSYVPERFRDLEWRLGGNFNFRGNNSDRRYGFSFSEQKSIWRAGSISSLLAYQWYTLPQFVNFTLDFRSELDYQHREMKEVQDYGTGQLRGNQKGSEHNFYLSGAPRVEIGRYVARDFFVALTGEGEFSRYERRYHSERTVERYDSGRVFSSDPTRSRSWRIDSRVHMAGGWMAGWGRVYSGSYAVTALEIMAALKKSGLLLRDPTPIEYRALCDTIYLFRRLHYFDTRDRQIEAVKSLTDQLVRSGIADKGSLPALLVNDVWQYYPRNDRPFGWRVYAGPVAIWDWQRKSTYPWSFWERDEESSNGSWGFRATAEYFRPISLRLQAEAAADLFFVSDDWRIRHSAKHYTGYRVSGDGKYFFDSRTSAAIHVARLQNPTPLDGLPTGRPRESIQYYLPTGYGITSRATELSIGIRYRIAAPTTIALSIQEYWTSAEPSYSPVKLVESGHYVSLGVSHWLY